ncbi:MAG: DUF4129 domain-containing protein [Brachybacterium sp.]|nr:DUF4129 domain-containing protein [Brachybacterium sp.]
MRRGGRGQLAAITLLLVTAATVGAVTLGAASSRDAEIGQVRIDGTFTPLARILGMDSLELTTPDFGSPAPVEQTPAVTTAFPLVTTGMVLALLFAALLILGLILRRRARREEQRSEAEADAARGELTTIEEAEDALRAAHARLRAPGGEGTDAIIQAWLALEASLQAAGVERPATLTTEEYVRRTLTRIDLDEDAIDDLAGLYRRALFDANPPGVAEQGQAEALVGRLHAQVTDRRRHTATDNDTDLHDTDTAPSVRGPGR